MTLKTGEAARLAMGAHASICQNCGLEKTVRDLSGTTTQLQPEAPIGSNKGCCTESSHYSFRRPQCCLRVTSLERNSEAGACVSTDQWSRFQTCEKTSTTQSMRLKHWDYLEQISHAMKRAGKVTIIYMSIRWSSNRLSGKYDSSVAQFNLPICRDNVITSNAEDTIEEPTGRINEGHYDRGHYTGYDPLRPHLE